MPTATMTTSSVSGERRDGFFVHRVQKGYAAWIGLILFLYSALFFTLAFYGPYLKPILTLYGQGPLEERQAAAAELLMLSETVWVAVPVLFFGAVIFSLVLTRRVAGPLYRLDKAIQEWANGNLSWRMRFQTSDRLDDLAETANQALDNIEQSFVSIRRRNWEALPVGVGIQLQRRRKQEGRYRGAVVISLSRIAKKGGPPWHRMGYSTIISVCKVPRIEAGERTALAVFLAGHFSCTV